MHKNDLIAVCVITTAIAAVAIALSIEGSAYYKHQDEVMASSGAKYVNNQWVKP